MWKNQHSKVSLLRKNVYIKLNLFLIWPVFLHKLFLVLFYAERMKTYKNIRTYLICKAAEQSMAPQSKTSYWNIQKKTTFSSKIYVNSQFHGVFMFVTSEQIDKLYHYRQWIVFYFFFSAAYTSFCRWFCSRDSPHVTSNTNPHKRRAHSVSIIRCVDDEMEHWAVTNIINCIN